MIPSAWVGAVLALAVFRLGRLLDVPAPQLARARAWVAGVKVATTGTSNQRMQLTSVPAETTVVCRRPLLLAALDAPLWLSAAVYAAWLLEPTPTLYAAAPLALSGAYALLRGPGR